MGKVLVTGAAGFIVSQLAYALWKQWEDVVLLDNSKLTLRRGRERDHPPVGWITRSTEK